MTTTIMDENNVTTNDVTDDAVTNRCMYNCQFHNQIKTLSLQFTVYHNSQNMFYNYTLNSSLKINDELYRFSGFT